MSEDLVYLKNKHTARVAVPGRRGAVEFVNPGQIVAIERHVLNEIGKPTEKRPGRRPDAGRDLKRHFEQVDRAAFDAGEYARLRYQGIERLDIAGQPMGPDGEESEETIKARAKAQQSKRAAPALRGDERASLGQGADSLVQEPTPPPPPPPPAKK